MQVNDLFTASHLFSSRREEVPERIKSGQAHFQVLFLSRASLHHSGDFSSRKLRFGPTGRYKLSVALVCKSK
jgi:hypothetical protein